MQDASRQCRILIKAHGLPQTSQALSAAGFDFDVEPLMPHVGQHNAVLRLDSDATWFRLSAEHTGKSDWGLCHRLASGERGLLPGNVEWAEPEIVQRWTFDDGRTAPAFAVAANCDQANPDQRFPSPSEPLWYRDDAHGGFAQALAALDAVPPGQRSKVRVAHLDTGYDEGHATLPRGMLTALARNFIDPDRPNDARDTTDGPLNNRGHGTGTLGILAGRSPEGDTAAIGAAPFVEIVPIRVANRVVLFSNASIARALDYVLSLADTDERIDIVTMSMGGLASRAWADAINALYDAGVFVVTAAGNNFGGLPTRNLVYPARFHRVVAACGTMADGKAYADLPPDQMAGNYGPPSRMTSAVAASTPNLPWAKLGCPATVDLDGAGTSSATPQIAAAAAIWLCQHGRQIPARGWQRVEAIRHALFTSADGADARHFGRGRINAARMLAVAPPDLATLVETKRDDVGFPFLDTLLGRPLAVQPDAARAMLELEALQLTQHWGIEAILEDPDSAAQSGTLPAEVRPMLIADARTSPQLRRALGAAGTPPPPRRAKARATAPTPPTATEVKQLEWAKNPPRVAPRVRKLRVFASDPAMQTALGTFAQAEATVEMPWEPLAPGPKGEYLEVVDIDPPSGKAYAPVDLDDLWLLHEHGLKPSETDPRFHQQMVYAVASRTIRAFEDALGRRALWAPHRDKNSGNTRGHYVQRLRIYPHALRMANAFYSPEKNALLFGYFKPGNDSALPTVFAALSHDVIAHETAHALLDGLHRRYIEATNDDVLAFHEAFADIVAIFQHFTLREAVRVEIAKSRGDLFTNNRLGELAVQFGQAMGNRGALRSYIGHVDADGQWQRASPKVNDYADAREAHARGAVLVGAVFDSFLALYAADAQRVIVLATGGSGVLPPGELSPQLIDALTEVACSVARRLLAIMIRALDYCPPFDLNFG